MSAYTDFLSHPKEEGITLKEHLEKVADKSRELMSQTKFTSADTAFLAGLLHDVGKLNPYYQQLFHADLDTRKELEMNLRTKYVRQHSIFSAWAARFLLKDAVTDQDSLSLVLSLIAGHHSALSKRISTTRDVAGFQESQDSIASILPAFRSAVSIGGKFTGLNWDECEAKFGRPISFQNEVKNGDIPRFLEACVLFSAVLQADRGSFGAWPQPSYDLKLDTSRLVHEGGELGPIRDVAQREILAEHDSSADLSVIHAPTGIGKTKVFLDTIDRYPNLERVIYFSPLLALTEDFEEKVRQVAQPYLDDILVYNHLFAGALSGKGSDANATEVGWNFANESFNSKFVITTTQRLLLTLYSNHAADKLKLMSFKNSLLILDEIQVVPKFLLPNLMDLLQEMCAKMNSKVIFVSATVPYELTAKRLSVCKPSAKTLGEYYDLTMKGVDFIGPLKSLPAATGGARILVMANTRRKALGLLKLVREDERGNVHYLTAGIKKKVRSRMLKEARSARNFIMVSTQVVEAGVDISFSEVFREVAPLDSIVQVMGRLSREAEVTRPTLHVFHNDEDHRPYPELEYVESLKILRTVRDSRELAGRLEEYYRTISSRNRLNQGLAEKLDFRERQMDFDGVWKLVSDNTFDGEDNPVIVPDSEEDLAATRNELLSSESMTKSTFRKYAGLVASLPGAVSRARHEGYYEESFDPDLMKRGILLPRKGKLHEMYDTKVGLDKWQE